MKNYWLKTFWYVTLCRTRCVECQNIMLPEDFPWENERCIPCTELEIERRYEAQQRFEALMKIDPKAYLESLLLRAHLFQLDKKKKEN